MVPFAGLPPEDAAALSALAARVGPVGKDRIIVQPGDRSDELLILLDGWAMRFHNLQPRRRQVSAFLLPGNVIQVWPSLPGDVGDTISAIGRAVVARVPRDALERLIAERPAVLVAMRREQLVRESLLRGWLTSIGRRNAGERVAHLICEIWTRAGALGLIVDNAMHFPVNQTCLGDALGLTPVHTNRTLQALRADGLIRLSAKTLEVPHFQPLADYAGFEGMFLAGPVCDLDGAESARQIPR